MPLFSCKKIPPLKRVCLRLKEARESRGMTIEEIEAKTRIDRRYLLALESCDFDLLPEGGIYQKQFIRAYLKAVDMKADDFVEQYALEEYGGQKQSHMRAQRTLRNAYLPNIPRLVSMISGTLAVVGIAGYLGWQINNILRPPSLTLASPEDGSIILEPIAIVRGETDPETRLKINGQEVSIMADGKFEKEIVLSSGVNTISVTAIKKHGKERREIRHVIHRQTDDLARSG